MSDVPPRADQAVLRHRRVLQAWLLGVMLLGLTVLTLAWQVRAPADPAPPAAGDASPAVASATGPTSDTAGTSESTGTSDPTASDAGGPVVVAFEVEPSRPVCEGDVAEVTVAWSAGGATRVVLEGGDDRPVTLAELPSPDVSAGTIPVTHRCDVGRRTYTLVVTDGSGREARRSVDVTAAEGTA